MMFESSRSRDSALKSAFEPALKSASEPEVSPFERILRPAVGFSHPSDVVKDPHLSIEEKRLVLSSWASDACAVDSRPGWRRPLGSDVEVPLAEVVDALERLDRPRPPWASSGPIAAKAQSGGFDARLA